MRGGSLGENGVFLGGFVLRQFWMMQDEEDEEEGDGMGVCVWILFLDCRYF